MWRWRGCGRAAGATAGAMAAAVAVVALLIMYRCYACTGARDVPRDLQRAGRRPDRAGGAARRARIVEFRILR
eukprot:6199714-Pleurochrysis_carterae.AAC.1